MSITLKFYSLLLFLLAGVFSFSIFSVNAYAVTNFNVTNPSYNPSTHELSFTVDPDTLPHIPGTAYGKSLQVRPEGSMGETVLGGADTDNVCQSTSSCTITLNWFPTGQTVEFNPNTRYHIYQWYETEGDYESQDFTFPSPTPAAQIITDPSSSTVTVGTPFYVDVKVESNTPFNAAQVKVTVPDDLDIVGDTPPSSGACDGMFLPKNDRTQHTYTFAGALMGGSSTGCTVRTLTILPNASGSYTIGLSEYYVKDSSSSADIPATEDEGSVTINDGPTPTPTVALSPLLVTSHVKTYYGGTGNEYTLTGTYESPITTVYVDGSQVSASDGKWNKSGITLDLGEDNHAGDNSFTIYGSDGSNQTATQVVHVERHLLGDINGDGVVDLDDASRLAVDYGSTHNLTYVLSNMNYDQENPDDVVDITDLSILARTWTNQ